MSLTLNQIWTAAGVLLGFQVTLFTLRISREINVGEKGDLTWLPLADIANLFSMLISIIGVFLLPIMGLVNLNFCRFAFGLSLIMFISYPFALAGHYDMFNKNTSRSYDYAPFQEKLIILFSCIVTLIYVVVFNMKFKIF